LDGSFQLLNNHSAIVSALKKGKVVVADNTNKAIEFNIGSGLVECSNNLVNILVEEA
jgi:F0F1-type ATP synthase epsilon subunit